MVRKTFLYRLYPSRTQARLLDATLETCRFFYNDTFRNSNNMLRFASRQVAADYAREFQQLFDGRFGSGKSSATPFPRVRVGGVPIEVYFSPEDGVAKYVLQRLNAAKRSINFMTVSNTSSAIAKAMIAQVKSVLPV